jgi:hypothetical protein
MNRRPVAIVAAGLTGAALGVVFAAARSPEPRAEAVVLVTSPGGPRAVTPMLPNLRELAVSSVLAANVRSTLRLPESVEHLRRDLSASIRPQTQAVAITVEHDRADDARRISQEAALVFAQLVDSRFGSDVPRLEAKLLDPGHLIGGRRRHLTRDGLIGAVAGLAAGLLLSMWRTGSRRAASSATAAAEARLLDQRVEEVAARERDTARRLGDLDRRERVHQQRVRDVARRELALSRRAGELAARERALETDTSQSPLPSDDLPAAPAPSEPPSPTEEVDEPLPLPDAAPRGANIEALERLIAGSSRDVSADQLEEWRTYLYFLREHAGFDGKLPAQFNSLIDEVFGSGARFASAE